MEIDNTKKRKEPSKDEKKKENKTPLVYQFTTVEEWAKTVPAYLRPLAEHGYVVVPDVVPQATLDEWKADVLRLERLFSTGCACGRSLCW